jgi:uncharacterized protein
VIVDAHVHPVHGNFAPNDRELYPAYAECQARGVPVITHTGPSSFPGASGRLGDPVLMGDVPRDLKWIFGTDWPGVPGIGANIKALGDLGLSPPVLDAVLGGNAQRVYNLVSGECGHSRTRHSRG